VFNERHAQVRSLTARTPALAEVQLTVAWQLSGDPSDDAFLLEARNQLDVDLPCEPNTFSVSKTIVTYWLSPRSWLLATSTSCLDQFEDRRDAINTARGALFDLSASRVAYRLYGGAAEVLLSSGCPLDLDPASFPPGACKRSVFNRVPVMIERRENAPSFTLFCARSFATYMWHALCQAGAPLGYTQHQPEPLA
jgi:heterotetrameric sarcosine oxidase gamma subunit